MATTSAPAVATNARPAAPQPGNAFNGTQRFVPPQRQRPDPPEADQVEEPDENPPNPPVFTFPQPGPNQPGLFPNAPANNNGPPVTITVNPSNGAPMNINPGVPASPAAPIGVSQPGMMVNPPAPNTPGAPGTIVRPPGRVR
jgi:hypothetical protein